LRLNTTSSLNFNEIGPTALPKYFVGAEEIPENVPKQLVSSAHSMVSPRACGLALYHGLPSSLPLPSPI
jgi:hypothetical protein